MGRFTRSAMIVFVALFLEGCAVYLVCRLIANVLQLPEAAIPLPVMALAMIWSFILSWYVQTIQFSLNLRGIIGLILSAASVLVLAGVSMGAGWFPLGSVFSGDLRAIAALALSIAFMLAMWWRGTAIARDDVTLDVLRNAFVRGVVTIVVAVASDPLIEANIVQWPLLFGYFAVGLYGLAMSRFTSEGATGHMSRGWMASIGLGVAAVLVLALVLGAAGVGGLDDLTRAVTGGLGWLGLWVLRPVLLLLGLLAAGMVALGNWVSGFFGGGDLSGLELARTQIQELHDSLRDAEGDGPPGLILTALKWLAAISAVSLAAWVLFRMFRRRRLVGGNYSEGEVRESLFTWQGAGQDISDAFSGWANWASNLRRNRPPPATPRDVYHRMLDVATTVGRPRREGQTPHEHRRDVSETLPEPPVHRIVDGFQDYYYGRQQTEPPAESMSSLLEDLDSLEPRL